MKEQEARERRCCPDADRVRAQPREGLVASLPQKGQICCLAVEQLQISERGCWPCWGSAGLGHVPHSSFPFCFKAEKKKGRSATFYPVDNSPFLLPVDETQLPALNSSMEPVGISTEMALLSNILAAYAFVTGRSCGCHLSGLASCLQTLSWAYISQSPRAKSASLNCSHFSFISQQILPWKAWPGQL